MDQVECHNYSRLQQWSEILGPLWGNWDLSASFQP